MRKIAVYDNFTEPKHRQQIDGTAARYGFAVDYYPAPQSVPEERRGEYEVISGLNSLSCRNNNINNCTGHRSLYNNRTLSACGSCRLCCRSGSGCRSRSGCYGS